MLYKATELHKYLFRHQFMRYLFIGGSTFIIDFGLLVVLHDLLNLNLLLSASISYWMSVSFNFTMNRLWTFNKTSKDSIEHHLLFYGLLLAFNYMFTVSFIWATTNLGVHYTFAKILAVGIQIPWTYYIYKKIFSK